MSSGGVQSTFLLTGAGDVLGDVGGFLSGPAGDPGRIRQIAGMVDTLAAEYRGATLALDDAVIALTQSWTGTAATAFRGAWTARTRSSPSTVLGALAANLAAFSRELRDYADKLEHAQNEHWIQLGLMAALSVLNAAQGGADPVTDAAEVAAGEGLEVATGISLAGLGELALGGAVSGFGSDALSQFGADLLDRCDPAFDRTGDDVVPVFDVGEAASSALNGALSEVDGGLWHGGGGGLGPGSGLDSGDRPALPAGNGPDGQGFTGVTPDGTLADAANAQVSLEKLTDYSMDPDSQSSGGKWMAFEQIGYSVRDPSSREAAAKDVIGQLRSQLPTAPATPQGITSYGQRVEVAVLLKGPTGRAGTLVTIWQYDNGLATPRLITNYVEVHR